MGDGLGMIQVHYLYYATTGLMGGGVQRVMKAMGSHCKYRRSFTGSPANHLLLCGPVLISHKPIPVCGPGVGDPWYSTLHHEGKSLGLEEEADYFCLGTAGWEREMICLWPFCFNIFAHKYLSGYWLLFFFFVLNATLFIYFFFNL